MRRALAIALIAAACASSRQQQAKHEIRMQYDKLERASAAQDAEGLIALRHPLFETFGPQGQHDDHELDQIDLAHRERWSTECSRRPPTPVACGIIRFA